MSLSVRCINCYYFVTSPSLGKDYTYAAFTSATVAQSFAVMLQRDYDIIGMSQRLNCRSVTSDDYRCWLEIEQRAKHITGVECPGLSLYQEMYPESERF